MAVVCNPIRLGIWYELMVVCVCHSDEVMREADANDSSGDLGSEFPWKQEVVGRNRVRWSAARLSNGSALPRTTDSTP